VSEKSYGQFCAIARALDVIGDRWTLLLVRELVSGPRRHRELKQGLAGVASNLLSDRLRELRAAGILERAELGGAAHYRLTDRGRALRPVLIELARWGAPLLPDLDDDSEFQPSWLQLTLDARLDRAAAGDQETALLLVIEGEPIDVAVSGSGVRSPAGRPPDIQLVADRRTFLEWGTQRLSDTEALAAGIQVTGGPAGLRRLRELFPVG
jgi:DNA-binding HxlR family transcriptional regulator